MIGGVQRVDARQRDAAPLVDISVGSRFHAFDLARELLAHGMLRHLHTGYPSIAAGRFGLPGRPVRSVWTHEPINRALGFLWRTGWIAREYDAPLNERFDRIVSRRLKPGADVFVGWSSQSLKSLERARRMGMVTVVERGSTHIEWQRSILREEAAATGFNAEIPSSATVDRELAEYEAADYIAVPSKFAAATFLERGIDAGRLLLNPYGVDLARFSASAFAPRRSDSVLRVISVGRVSVQKGAHHLVEAVRRVSNARLAMVGGIDPGMDHLLRHGRVDVVGAVPGRDLPAHYARADVFCLLSLQEGLAQVLVQAMAMGLPVIATPNTGAGELITDGEEGFLVPARDPEAAAGKMALLAADPALRRAMGEKARARVESGFSWADYGRRAVRNYLSITKPPAAASQSMDDRQR